MFDVVSHRRLWWRSLLFILSICIKKKWKSSNVFAYPVILSFTVNKSFPVGIFYPFNRMQCTKSAKKIYWLQLSCVAITWAVSVNSAVHASSDKIIKFDKNMRFKNFDKFYYDIKNVIWRNNNLIQAPIYGSGVCVFL